MEENKNKANEQNPHTIEEDIKGRVNNNQNPNFQDQDVSSDISNVDQQEGTMNNGTIGGSMSTSDTNPNSGS